MAWYADTDMHLVARGRGGTRFLSMPTRFAKGVQTKDSVSNPETHKAPGRQTLNPQTPKSRTEMLSWLNVRAGKSIDVIEGTPIGT